MRRARTDVNQRQIAAALRQIGATVVTLHRVGDGCPDLLVGRCGATYLLEVKRDARALRRRTQTSDRQAEFRARWRGGALVVVSSVAEALLAVTDR